jgi:O-antigen/teichoic acid export membrane protein
MLKRLLHLLTDSLTYGVSSLLGQFIGVMLLPLYTKVLLPSDYGTLAMLAFVPQIVATIAASGVKTAFLRQFYQTDDEQCRRLVLSTAAMSVLLSVLIMGSIGFLAADWLAVRLIGTVAAAPLLRMSLFSAAISTLMELPLVSLQARRQAKVVGALNVFQLLTVTTMTIYFVVQLRLGAMGVILGGLVGNALSALVCLYVTAKHFANAVDFGIWKVMASYAWPLIPHRIQAALMVFLGSYVIREYLGLADAGLYDVATRFAMPIAFISAAVQQAWNPYKFKVFAEDTQSSAFFRSTATYYVFALSYLWMGVSAWGPDALRFLTDPAFHNATNFVWAIALMRTSQAFYPLMATGIELSSNTRAVPLVSFASLIAVIISSVVLVPLFGPVGAALATTVAWLVMAAGYFILGRRQIQINYDWTTMGALVALAAIMIVLCQYLQSTALWMRLSVLGILSFAYPVLGLMILFHSSTERHRVSTLLQRAFGWQQAALRNGNR